MISAKKHAAFLAANLLLLAGTPAGAQLGIIANGGSQAALTILLNASASEAIRSCAYDARSQLLRDINDRLVMAAGALVVLSEEIKARPGPTLENFATALDEARIQEAALKLQVAAAQEAAADAWPALRTALAASYMNFVGAVSRAETTAADQRG